MIKVSIPGEGELELKHIVLDYNGTLAKDGILLEGVSEKIRELKKKEVEIYILTSDTCGSVERQCSQLPVTIKIFDKANAVYDKQRVVEELGANFTVAFGNGKNDLLMFKSCQLAIAVLGYEGCFTQTLLASDIVVNDIIDGLDLILHASRMRATLRS